MSIGHNNPELLREFIEYDQNTGVLTWKNRDQIHFKTRRGWAIWNARYAGTLALNCDDTRGYKMGRVKRRSVFAHRAAWAIAHGEWPNAIIDHINGDRSDNRLKNLRLVTNAENGQNSKRSVANKTGVTGVCWVKSEKRYKAYIGAHPNREYLGSFSDLDLATAARKAAEVRLKYHKNHGRDQ